MKRAIRPLAAPAVAMLLLASCGSSSEPTEEQPPAAQEAPAASDGDESDAWPIVEDEDGNVIENPEDQPMDDGGDDTMFDSYPMDWLDDEGNIVPFEFGDGELLEVDEDAINGDPVAPGARFYGISENGGDFVITTQIDPVEDLEAYREQAGGEPVGYMSVDVDNREGTENINMYQVAVYDAAGNEYIFTSADEVAGEWRELLGSDNVDVYNEGVELSNKYLNQGASAHQRSTMILTGPELPGEIVAVVAMPRGIFETAPTIPLQD